MQYTETNDQFSYQMLCMRAQPCPTLCDPMDCSPPGSSVHGTSQARILEWVVNSFSRGSSQPKGRTYISYISFIGRQVFTTSATWEAPLIYLRD